MSSLVIFTETNSVILRQLRPEHTSAYYEAVDANREHLSRFEDETSAMYPDAQSVEDSITSRYQHKLRFGIWNQDKFVGSIEAEPGMSKTEVGYWLDERYTGQGYATIALRAISSYVADRFGRPYAWVNNGNMKSIKVLERAGFVSVDLYEDRCRYELPPEAS